MKVHHITPYFMDGNIYLIEDEIFVLVDSGTGQMIPRQIKEIRDILSSSNKECQEAKLSYIVLTHYHFDHSGGAAQFKKVFGCEVFVHKAEVEALKKGDSRATGATLFFSSQPKVEVRALELSSPIETGEGVFQILHTPGHSPGSICLYEEERGILISGDTVFAGGGIGRWDLSGGNYQKLVESIEFLNSLEVRDIYPGHGPTVKEKGKENLRACLRYVKSILF